MPLTYKMNIVLHCDMLYLKCIDSNNVYSIYCDALKVVNVSMNHFSHLMIILISISKFIEFE